MRERAKQQITAIIYDKRGRVLSVGQNSYVKTHPMQAHHARKIGNEHAIYLHAEVHAITRCSDLSKAHRIVVVRYNKDGTPALAKPCPICASAIAATSIQVIEHT
jgi:tRNA(Arg) A34 adenosine deaminase TadA